MNLFGERKLSQNEHLEQKKKNSTIRKNYFKEKSSSNLIHFARELLYRIGINKPRHPHAQ
jgi:hypothetical protein